MVKFMSEVYKSLKSTVLGMRVTVKNLFTPAITVQYPDERLDLPVGYRGIPVLLTDAEGNSSASRASCVSGMPRRVHRDPVP